MRSIVSRAPITTLVFILVVCGAIGASVGCATDSGQAETDDAPTERPHNVRVLEIQTESLEEYLIITGPLSPAQATDVATEESGVVQELPVAKGDLVRKGQVIAQLDRRLLEAQMKSARAVVALREFNDERTKKLFDANSISRQEMLAVETELEQAQQQARVMELRFERAAIKAPFDGIVTDRLVELGQLVSPGQPVSRIVDPFNLELEGWVTEKSVMYLREGAPAMVSVDGLDAVVPGTLKWVSMEANPRTGKFGVEISVDNRELILRAGIVGRARVLKTVHEAVIAIPRDAVVHAMEGTVVYVIDGDRARARPVELGADQGMMVVLESGLSSGERIAVRGQRELSDGSLVRVQEVAQYRDGTIDSDPAEVKEEGRIQGYLDMQIRASSAASTEGSR